MKNIYKFILLYFSISLIILTVYLYISNNFKEDLNIAKQEAVGVEYLHRMYKVAINSSIYQGLLEVKDTKNNIQRSHRDLLKSTDDLYALQNKYPEFISDEFNNNLEKVKSSTLDAKTNYRFLEAMNHENYRIGNISNLLFEKDKKTYFLVSLATHYMPEYLISILITHNIAEEFQIKDSITDYKISQYTKHNKLLYLSYEEIATIIKILKDYNETEQLASLIESIRKKIELLPENKNSFFNKNTENISILDYLKWSHSILELSYKLNDENFLILRSTLKQRIVNLETNILNSMLLFILIFILTSVVLYYFYRSFMDNIKKDTEIKKINNMLDDLVIFAQTDTQGRITYISSALEELSGFSLNEMKGKTFNIFANKDDKGTNYKELWKTIVQKKVWTGEFNNITKDGSIYSLKSRISPDLDSNDKLIGYISYSSNTTDIKNFEKSQEELIDKEKMMITQSRSAAMGEMISMIAHQWRQPLSAISATSMNIKMKSELEIFDFSKEEEARKYEVLVNSSLDKINDFVESLSVTIDDFRNFFKPNKIMKNLLLEIIINKALSIIKPSLINENIKIIEEYNSKEEIALYDNELIQVVLNILKNAQDNFVENKTDNPYIKITTNNRTISISDNAGGIPEDIIEKIFDPYFSTKNEKNGTGLGLYMSKTIVQKHHNGKLTVKNTDDGVCFTIEIGILKD